MNGVSNAANVVLAIRSSSSIMDGRRRATRRNDPFAYQRWSEPRAIPPLFSMDGLRQRLEYARSHVQEERRLFSEYWKVILIGLVFQYVHSVATNVAYYMHIPREPLADLGFTLIPPFTRDQQIYSEYLFFTCFGLTLCFILVYPSFDISRRHQPITKRLYSVIMLARCLAVCALAQGLRIVTFLVTSLPGPNYHCRPNSKEYDPPRGLYDIFARQDPFTHCGDLVFSSHTIFIMLCVLTWKKYSGLPEWSYYCIYVFVLIFGAAVISARKHYTLDVVVAMYTVPLLWIAYDHKYPDKIPPEMMAEQVSAEEMEGLACDVPAELPREVRVDGDEDDIEMQLNAH